jgi:hypothetical protein
LTISEGDGSATITADRTTAVENFILLIETRKAQLY